MQFQCFNGKSSLGTYFHFFGIAIAIANANSIANAQCERTLIISIQCSIMHSHPSMMRGILMKLATPADHRVVHTNVRRPKEKKINNKIQLNTPCD